MLPSRACFRRQGALADFLAGLSAESVTKGLPQAIHTVQQAMTNVALSSSSSVDLWTSDDASSELSVLVRAVDALLGISDLFPTRVATERLVGIVGVVGWPRVGRLLGDQQRAVPLPGPRVALLPQHWRCPGQSVAVLGLFGGTEHSASVVPL